MRTEILKSFPPNVNPFTQDIENMGQYLGTNCAVMYGNFEDKECRYLIVIDIVTGERIKIIF